MQEQTVEIIKAFISGEMEIDQFMNHLRALSEIGDYLEGIISHLEENHIPPRRRIEIRKGVAQNKPYAQRSQAELFIREYAQSFCDLSDESFQRFRHGRIAHDYAGVADMTVQERGEGIWIKYGRNGCRIYERYSSIL